MTPGFIPAFFYTHAVVGGRTLRCREIFLYNNNDIYISETIRFEVTGILIPSPFSNIEKRKNVNTIQTKSPQRGHSGRAEWRYMAGARADAVAHRRHSIRNHSPGRRRDRLAHSARQPGRPVVGDHPDR